MIKRKDIYALALMIFFWTIFDGIVSYTVPVFFIQNGLTNTFMGFILATSSIGGALFDFVLAHFVKDTDFRRIFLCMFFASLIFPLILFASKLIIFYILAMVIWGIYYDFANFGKYDFIGKRIGISRHADGFGIVSVFSSLGYIIAPAIAGFIVIDTVKFSTFLSAFMFLLFSFLMYLMLLKLSNLKDKQSFNAPKKGNFNIFKEIKIWPTIAKEVWPVLLFISLINISDSFFWTIGPLFSQSLKNSNFLGGFLLTIYGLPILVVGWFTGKLTRKLGKKKTAMVAFLLGSLILSLIVFSNNLFFIISVVFVSSLLSSIAWPSIEATFADYIYESHGLESHIEGLVDFATNLGYIIGPVLAGVVSDKFGNRFSFGILGVFSVMVTLVLMKFTHRTISVSGEA
jgi:MFS family permease